MTQICLKSILFTLHKPFGTMGMSSI